MRVSVFLVSCTSTQALSRSASLLLTLASASASLASKMAGSIFEHTKLALTTWFLAIYLLTQHKSGISALQLRRDLGIGYTAAWMLKHKLMQVMLAHQQGERLAGRVEINDAYIGGEHSGKVGRGSPNKVPMIAAVQTTEDKKPVTTQLRRVSGFSKPALANYARISLQLDCTVWSEGLACFKAVTEAGCTHKPLVTGGGRFSAKKPACQWVNTMLGNVKNAITGNCSF